MAEEVGSVGVCCTGSKGVRVGVSEPEWVRISVMDVGTGVRTDVAGVGWVSGMRITPGMDRPARSRQRRPDPRIFISGPKVRSKHGSDNLRCLSQITVRTHGSQHWVDDS